MKTTAERPYRTMMSIAATVSQLPANTSARHLRALATELAAAVRDLDARLRAGLARPQAWDLRPQHITGPPQRWGPWVLPEQPAPGTVVAPARPTDATRGRSWRRVADGERGTGWLPQHEPEAGAQSWPVVLRQCGGAIRITHPATVPARVLAWRHCEEETPRRQPHLTSADQSDHCGHPDAP